MTTELDSDGPAAPPRSNGELVFEAPWESRVFGIGMAMVEGGRCTWDEFREHLIAAIDRWERSDPTEPYRYYERWQEAVESIAEGGDLITVAELDERAVAIGRRPAGHDHG